MRHEQNESAIDDSFCGNYVVDEGRSLGAVFQEKASNPLPLLQAKRRGSEQRRKRPEVYRVRRLPGRGAIVNPRFSGRKEQDDIKTAVCQKTAG